VPLGSLLAVAARSQVGDAKTRVDATQQLAPVLIEDYWWRVLPVLGRLSPPTVLAVYAAWFAPPGASSGSDPTAGNRLALGRGRGRHRQTGSRVVRRPGRL
jgi:hypothetical protein